MGDSVAAFPKFPELPPEIRLEIWKLTLPDAEPEVCIVWPLSNWMPDEMAARPFMVDTGFPVAMHVSHEARAAILEDAKTPSSPSSPSSTSLNPQPPQLRLRFSPAAGCDVPFRPYDPLIDTLYFSWSNFQSVTLAGFWDGWPDDFQRARHLAWEPETSWNPYVHFLLGGGCPAAETLTLVYAEGWGDGQNDNWIVDPIQAPARRCKLRRFEEPPADADAMTVVSCYGRWDIRDAPILYWDGDQSFPRGQFRLRIADFHGEVRWQINDRLESWARQSGEGVPVRKMPEIVAGTFVEFRPGGTWVEACAKRRIPIWKDETRHEEARDTRWSETPYHFPKVIPRSQWGDPTKYRVNDDNAELPWTNIE